MAAPGSTPDQLDHLDWKPAAVPNTAAGALRDLQAWDWDVAIDFDAMDWWWRVRLSEVHGSTGAAVLGFDGLATLADVWLDGVHLLHSDNMFVAHEVPIVLDGSQELLIRLGALTPELTKKRPRPRWRVPMLAHAQLRWFRTTLLGRTPGWSPPCPAVGPWRPVWIEQRAMTVGEVTLRSRIESRAGIVDVAAELGTDVSDVVLVVERDGQRTRGELVLRDGRWQGRAIVEAAEIWWPHTHGVPACYLVSIEACRAGNLVTIDLGLTGFRTIEIQRENGDFAVRVNGVDVFCRGACWTPLDVVTLATTPEAYRNAIAQARAAGMNMLRVSGAMVYEDDAFYDALDEHGLLLWQDLMFANMDYPEEATFVAGVLGEVDQQLARWQARPCLALICGNSEGEQQAAMSGAARELWSPRLFHETIAARVHAIGVAYTPSSAHGGAFPHAVNAGTSSYYGVGAYLRPLEDARRSEVRFASECLAFANVPQASALPAERRVHHAAWKATGPRDLGAGWDFDDVRDHYVQCLFDVDPGALRVSDHARYLALGRIATGEVMARTFGEWRRARSTTAGGLVWFLRDLRLGAGWGLIDARGTPKPAWWILRRALAPLALAITDEGSNGLALHVVNDNAEPFAGTLELILWRDGTTEVGRAARAIVVPARDGLELAAGSLFDYFVDLSWAYRFGPPVAQAIQAKLGAASSWWFPAGLALPRSDIGLSTNVQGRTVVVRTARFAQFIAIDVPGWVPDDNYFHLAPGEAQTVAFVPLGTPTRSRGTLTALNTDAELRLELE